MYLLFMFLTSVRFLDTWISTIKDIRIEDFYREPFRFTLGNTFFKNAWKYWFESVRKYCTKWKIFSRTNIIEGSPTLQIFWLFKRGMPATRLYIACSIRGYGLHLSRLLEYYLQLAYMERVVYNINLHFTCTVVWYTCNHHS